MGADDPPQTEHYSFPIILTELIITLLFILLFIFRGIRGALRRAAHRRYLATITSAPDHYTEQPKLGLDPSVIATLPVFVFRHDDSDHNCNNMISIRSNVDCSVCLCMFEDGEMVRILPNCKHNFHAECIDLWLESKSTCPVCRTEAKPISLVTEPREGPMEHFGVRLKLVTSGLLNNEEGTSSIMINDGSANINGSFSRLSSLKSIE